MNITNGWMPVAKMFWCVVGMICASSTNLWERSLGQDLPTWHHAAAAMHVSCAEEQVYQQWFFWILVIVRCVFFSCPWYYYSNIQTNKWWKGVIYTKLELETFFLFSVWVEELEQGKQKNKGLRAEIKKDTWLWAYCTVLSYSSVHIFGKYSYGTTLCCMPVAQIFLDQCGLKRIGKGLNFLEIRNWHRHQDC